MAEKALVAISPALPAHDEAPKMLVRVAITVPAVVLLGGAVGLALQPQFGLFAAATILGWTQLVGL